MQNKYVITDIVFNYRVRFLYQHDACTRNRKTYNWVVYIIQFLVFSIVVAIENVFLL